MTIPVVCERSQKLSKGGEHINNATDRKIQWRRVKGNTSCGDDTGGWPTELDTNTEEKREKGKQGEVT